MLPERSKAPEQAEVLDFLKQENCVLADYCKNLALGQSCATFDHPGRKQIPPQTLIAALSACKRHKVNKKGSITTSSLCEGCFKWKDRERPAKKARKNVDVDEEVSLFPGHASII